jgi:dipeptidyl aminopeptidase/acylaminoacyl peptidase
LLFDCTEWYGNCHLEGLSYNGTLLTFRTITEETTWYEMDIISIEMQILGQSIHGCGAPENRNLYQSIAVNYVCGSHGTYEFLNLETGDVTTLANVSSLLFTNNATHYAYTISHNDADVDRNGDTLPNDIFVAQWGDESSIRLLAGNVADVLEGWHPDNKRLLTSRYTVEDDTVGGYEFVLYDSETGEATSLLYLVAGRPSQVRWNADGTKFAYVVNPIYGFDLSSTIVWVYDLASGKTTLIGHYGLFPQWAN